MKSPKDRLELASLSNRELARLIMRHLWITYDSGGVSLGRSLRSALLESITRLIPVSEDKEVDFGELVQEAEKRKIKAPGEYQLEFPVCISEAHLLSLDTFTSFVVLEMKRWYEKDKKDNPTTWMIGETRIVNSLFRLVVSPGTFRQFNALRISFTPKDLIREGEERLYKELRKEYRTTHNGLLE